MLSDLFANTAELSARLEALGGGDARLAPLETIVRVVGADMGPIHVEPAPEDGVIVGVKARDGSRRTFRASEAHHASHDDEIVAALARSALEWVWDGFNATVIGYGQSGTAQKQLLFAHQRCLVQRALALLFELVQESSRPNDFSVGMSLLELDGRRSYDLIAKVLGQNYQDVVVNSKQKLVEVTVRNERQARDVLQAAAGRASAEAYSHTFVRIVLYDEKKNCHSCLNVVDLAPLVGVDAHSSGATIQQQKIVNKQLLSFSRLVSSLASRGTSNSASSREAPVRDTKLIEFLSPLISRNSKTFILASLSNSPADYLATVGVLRLISRALNICSASIRPRGIDGLSSSLDFRLVEQAIIDSAPRKNQRTRSRKPDYKHRFSDNAHQDTIDLEQILCEKMESRDCESSSNEEDESGDVISRNQWPKHLPSLAALAADDVEPDKQYNGENLVPNVFEQSKEIEDNDVDCQEYTAEEHEHVDVERKVVEEEEKVRENFPEQLPEASMAEFRDSYLRLVCVLKRRNTSYTKEDELNRELQISNLLLENISLKERCQKLQQQAQLNDVFEVYERDMARLEKRSNALERHNVTLQLQLADCLRNDSNVPKGRRALYSLESSAIRALERSLHESAKKVSEMRVELADAKSAKRTMLVSKRCLSSTTTKLNSLSRTLGRTQQELKCSDKERERMHKQVDSMSGELETLKCELKTSKELGSSLQSELNHIKALATKLSGEHFKRSRRNNASSDSNSNGNRIGSGSGSKELVPGNAPLPRPPLTVHTEIVRRSLVLLEKEISEKRPNRSRCIKMMTKAQEAVKALRMEYTNSWERERRLFGVLASMQCSSGLELQDSVARI